MAQKTYVDELAEWVAKQKDKPRLEKHLVAFLALKSDIQTALEAGYTRKLIWLHMKETGRLDCRYETFIKHIKRFIKSSSVIQSEPPKNALPMSKSKPEKREQKKHEAPKPGQIVGFAFNPTPNEKELL